jgi:hypothetical protein
MRIDKYTWFQYWLEAQAIHDPLAHVRDMMM